MKKFNFILTMFVLCISSLIFFGCGVNINSEENKVQVALSSSSYVYSGKEITPSIVFVKVNNVVLSSKNYEYEISDNKNVGTATMIFKFKKGYQGTYKKTFKITKKTVALANLKFNSKDYDGINIFTLKNPENIVIDGVCDGDDLNIDLVNAYGYVPENYTAGTNNVYLKNAKLTGESVGNYELATQSSSTYVSFLGQEKPEINQDFTVSITANTIEIVKNLEDDNLEFYLLDANDTKITTSTNIFTNLNSNSTYELHIKRSEKTNYSSSIESTYNLTTLNN